MIALSTGSLYSYGTARVAHDVPDEFGVNQLSGKPVELRLAAFRFERVKESGSLP